MTEGSAARDVAEKKCPTDGGKKLIKSLAELRACELNVHFNEASDFSTLPLNRLKIAFTVLGVLLPRQTNGAGKKHKR